MQNIKDHSIFMMDLEGNITTWNAEAEKIIGYKEAEILGFGDMRVNLEATASGLR